MRDQDTVSHSRPHSVHQPDPRQEERSEELPVGQAATQLIDRGFTANEAGLLADVKRRYLCGDFREAGEQDRLYFARWLVETGRLDEWRIS